MCLFASYICVCVNGCRKQSATSLLCVGFLMLQMIVQPFAVPDENMAETASLAVLSLVALTLPLFSVPFNDFGNGFFAMLLYLPSTVLFLFAFYSKVQKTRKEKQEAQQA